MRHRPADGPWSGARDGRRRTGVALASRTPHPHNCQVVELVGALIIREHPEEMSNRHSGQREAGLELDRDAGMASEPREPALQLIEAPTARRMSEQTTER